MPPQSQERNDPGSARLLRAMRATDYKAYGIAGEMFKKARPSKMEKERRGFRALFVAFYFRTPPLPFAPPGPEPPGKDRAKRERTGKGGVFSL